MSDDTQQFRQRHWTERHKEKVGFGVGSIISLIACVPVLFIVVNHFTQPLNDRMDKLEKEIEHNEQEITEVIKTLNYYQGMIDAGGIQ